MVILRSQNKITDFFMILAWASPFNYEQLSNSKAPYMTFVSATLALKPTGYSNTARRRPGTLMEVPWDLGPLGAVSPYISLYPPLLCQLPRERDASAPAYPAIHVRNQAIWSSVNKKREPQRWGSSGKTRNAESTLEQRWATLAQR